MDEEKFGVGSICEEEVFWGYVYMRGDVHVGEGCEEGMKVSLLIVFCNTDAEVG